MNSVVFRRPTMLAILLLLFTFTACSNRKAATKSNFESALNSYFQQHPECLYVGSLPIERNNLGRATDLDPIVEAGLLSRTASGNHLTYDVTPTGQKALKMVRLDMGGEVATLCYGNRKVTEIEQFTEPGSAGGPQVSQVTYKYKIANFPEWVKLDSLQKAYPQLKIAIETETKPVEDGHAMVLMNDGWSAGK